MSKKLILKDEQVNRFLIKFPSTGTISITAYGPWDYKSGPGPISSIDLDI